MDLCLPQDCFVACGLLAMTFLGRRNDVFGGEAALAAAAILARAD